jgi:hypothetical protein
MSNNLFELASRKQLRFTSGKGDITTEDLWSLSLRSLDTMAVNLHGKIEKTPTTSFLENPDRKANTELVEDQLRLEILKHVISVKQDENKAVLAQRDKVQERQTLEALLEKKRLNSLDDLSEEDLKARIAALA